MSSLSMSQKISLTWQNGLKYLPLLKNLISRELKKKYRQSTLGYVWCVLNPLLTMLIMSLVFSRIFKRSIENFPVYLCAGRLMFSYITDSAHSMINSISGNSRLMRKTRIPYYVFPLAGMGSTTVNFGFQIIALLIVLVCTGTWPTIHVAAFPLVFLELALFSFGLGMMLAVANVYVKDTNYIFSVVTTAWVYLSVLFYPITVLPATLQRLITLLNPAYYFVYMSRQVFLYHEWPAPMMLLKGCVAGVVFALLGLRAYSRAKKTLILYV